MRSRLSFLFAWLLGAVAVAHSAAVSQEELSAGLPTFRHWGVVLDYDGLKYNPANDVIFPTVVRNDGHFGDIKETPRQTSRKAPGWNIQAIP